MADVRSRERKFRRVGNTVFYAMPSAETVARWTQETPNSFRFCPKVLRSISHEGLLYQRVRALVPLPALAWQPEEPESGPEQMRLF